MSDRRPVQTAERVAWVDCAKGIGIILVVVGHVLRGLNKTSAAVPGCAAIDSWIYAFHMPLFFFLSGLFLERSTSQPLGGFISARVRRIIWPYVVWSLLQETFRHISRNPDALAFRDFWTIVYRPVMQFWFLYVLFFLLIFYGLWRKVGRGWWSFAILALLLNLSMDFGVNYGPWGVLYQMWMNIPYLAFGVVFSESGGMRLAGNMRSVRLGALIVAGYLVVAAAVRLAGWPLDFLAVPVASTGIAASCAAAIVASRLNRLWISWIEVLGSRSLEIFVAHTIFASVLRQGLLAAGVLNSWVHLGLGTLVGLAGPIALWTICRRWNFGLLFSFPARKGVG